jgi:hypothetical protein
MARELWNTAKEVRLLHIRGSPASGKTTLRTILANYICINDPSYNVFTITAWAENDVMESGGYTRQLESITDIPYSILASQASKDMILFDESQDSYWDHQLWSDFLKSLRPGLGPIVIMFASFGSAGRMPVQLINTTAAPLLLMSNQRIGLYPSKESRFGLLMVEDEAMDLIERTLASFSTSEMIVEKELLKYLHIITDGHCGALSSLTYQLYNVCSMLPMSIIVSSVACVIEANSTQFFRDEYVGILISLLKIALKRCSQIPLN